MSDHTLCVGFRPRQIHNTAFVAPNATVIGDVTLHFGTSVWYHAVLRGDVAPIVVHARSNIQDSCILHGDAGFPTTIDEGVTVGHGAIIHGATVYPNTLIGMRAVLLNGVVVGENCLVAAGALLTQGKTFPPGQLIMGAPARVVRALTKEEIAHNRQAAQKYYEHAQAYKDLYTQPLRDWD